MICRAAVKIYDKRQDKVIVIPCHRHCDAFQILHDFGYKRFTDYEEIAQGFLDEHDNFLSRHDAWREAKRCNQFTAEYRAELASRRYHPATPTELFSEDLW